MVFDVPRTRPAYPPEFRQEAVQLLLSGRTPQELSKSLGVSEQTLRNWRRQAQLDRGERDDGLATDEREELRRLRRENRPARAGARHPQARHGLLREGDRDPVTVYRYISAEKAHCEHSVSLMCELLGVSTSGYYEWAGRAPSD